MEENELLIGNKEFIRYIKSLDYLFNKQNKKEVVLRARGKNVLKAISVAIDGKDKFLDKLNLKISKVGIGKVKYQDENKNKEFNISTIEIVLSK